MVDTSAIPVLTGDETNTFKRLKDDERERLRPEMQAARGDWIERRVEDVTKKGVPEAEARKQAEFWGDSKILSGAFPLPFDDRMLAGTTVKEALAAPDKYVNKKLSDPHEGPSYGRGKAILYRRPNGSLWIKSFAHGGIDYDLKSEFDIAVERLAKLAPEQYEQERKPEADKLGVRLGVLDEHVDAARERLDHDAAGDERKPKQADILVELSAKAELFHTPDGTGYATVAVDSHFETWAIRSKGFRRWLVGEFHAQTSSAPNSDALRSALNVIEARAVFSGVARQVHTRIANHDGRIYLDLADEKWRGVEISPAGWQVIDSPPVRFRRASGMLPLPDPVRGGSINELRPLLNTGTDEDFVLTVAFLLSALSGCGPYPILNLLGEHGSAKSTFSRVLRKLVDPNSLPLRSLPRNEHELYISAVNAFLLAFDNISWLADLFSDALCRLSTGGGFSARTLYENDEECLFEAMRPIILNGIVEFVTRPDLADRLIVLALKAIPDDRRKAEKDFWADFAHAYPRILGALLDGVSHGLRRLPETRLNALPRMADFALWATACETAYWKAGTFALAYDRNREEAVQAVIEASLVASAVETFMATRTQWEGTSTELLTALTAGAEEQQAKLKEWPKTARALSSRLRTVAATLRKAGIEVAFDREGRRGRKRIIAISQLSAEILRPHRPQSVTTQDGHWRLMRSEWR
jgi:hypothetical protein